MLKALIVGSTLLVCLTSAATAGDLVGTWQTTHAADSTGPSWVQTVTYFANGTWVVEFAVPPLPNGTGSFVMHGGGTYQMEGPTAVRVTFGDTTICGEGVGCMPAARFGSGGAALLPPAGTTKVYHFQFRGDDQVISEDGSISVRIN